MKYLYSVNCDGVFWVYGSSKVDLSKATPTEPIGVEDYLADQMLKEMGGKFVFEVKVIGGEVAEQPTEKFILGITPYIIEWDKIPATEAAQEAFELGVGDPDWNCEWFIDRNGNEIQLKLKGCDFMYEMDFIECSDDVEEEMDEEAEQKQFDEWIEALIDEDPKGFSGMLEYEPKTETKVPEQDAKSSNSGHTVIEILDYQSTRKMCKKLGYKGKNGYSKKALNAFLDSMKIATPTFELAKILNDHDKELEKAEPSTEIVPGDQK